MTIVDDGVMESTCRGGCGGQGEAAPRWWMVDGVIRGQLREGRRLRTMGNGWRGRASDLAGAGGGGNIMVSRCSSSSAYFCRGSTVGIIWREKKIFPGESGKYPG